jgi:hypothetical protein
MGKGSNTEKDCHYLAWNNGDILLFPVRCRGSERTSPEERGPVEAPLRRKTETDRVREGISEGIHSAEPERVASGGVGAVEPRHPDRILTQLWLCVGLDCRGGV